MEDGYVLHTNPEWLNYNASHHIGQRVAFMRGPKASLTRFKGGELLVFLRRGVNPHEIGGIATFIRNNKISLGKAWQTYGNMLGADQREDFYRLAPIENPTDESLTTVLEAENFRVISPCVRLDLIGIKDKQGATRGWYLSTEETDRLFDHLAVHRSESEESGFREGNRVFRHHLRLERNQHLVSLAKRRWFECDPELRCEVCRFSFVRRYGSLGKHFIEAHHRQPLNELREGVNQFTRVSDLAPVCGNCHRMLHVDGGRTLEDLRDLLRDDG
jgi:hypothetical protein